MKNDHDRIKEKHISNAYTKVITAHDYKFDKGTKRYSKIDFESRTKDIKFTKAEIES